MQRGNIMEQNNEIMSFSYINDNVRVILIDGEPWFMAKDIADVLGYAKTYNMLKRLRRNCIRKSKASIMEPLNNRYGNNDLAFINEAGLYTAILGSQRPEAGMFQDWIVEDVLPSIRKTGKYSIVANELPQTYGELVLEYGKTLIDNEQKQHLLETQAPKVESYESLMSASGYISMADVAKIISETIEYTIGRNILFRILRYLKVLNRENLPYQVFVNKGYFKIVASNPNNIGIKRTTIVSPQGLEFIRDTILDMTEYDLSKASGSARVVKAISKHAWDGGQQRTLAVKREISSIIY